MISEGNLYFEKYKSHGKKLLNPDAESKYTLFDEFDLPVKYTIDELWQFIKKSGKK